MGQREKEDANERGAKRNGQRSAAEPTAGGRTAGPLENLRLSREEGHETIAARQDGRKPRGSLQAVSSRRHGSRGHGRTRKSPPDAESGKHRTVRQPWPRPSQWSQQSARRSWRELPPQSWPQAARASSSPSSAASAEVTPLLLLDRRRPQIAGKASEGSRLRTQEGQAVGSSFLCCCPRYFGACSVVLGSGWLTCD